MKVTRVLFVVCGYQEHIETVLDALQFKGLEVMPPGKPVTSSDLESAFKQNKSIACSIKSFPDGIPDKALLVLTTTDTNPLANDSTFLRIIDVSKDNIVEQFSKIVELYNIDIGDFKSNSSGLSDGPTIDDCVYCKYLHGDPLGNERIIYQNDTCFAIPTVGEFRTGYILIIPKKHVMSMAHLNPSELQEFEEAIEDVEFILRQVYQTDILIWENGSGASGAGKAKDSIVHAHLHLCPSNITSDDIEKMSGFPFEDVTLESLHRHKDHPYLLIRTPDKSKWRIADSSKLYVPRQYVRQILAEECGCKGEEYNWRKYPFKRKMSLTVQDIAKYLNSNKDSLPESIKRHAL